MNIQLIDTQTRTDVRPLIHTQCPANTERIGSQGIGAHPLDVLPGNAQQSSMTHAATIRGIESPALAAASALQELSAQLRDPTLAPARFGVLGEEYAAAWLARRGWSTLSRNWHTRYGELDLVMLDPERTIVFVEVKTRRTMRYGSPQEAVTARKRLRLRRAGVQWLLEPEHRIAHNGVRFDVISILLEASGPSVRYIPEAF
jgi:putative endonuclease